MEKLPWILLVAGAVIGVMSIIVGWVIVPNIVEKKVNEQVQIKNGTQTFWKWSTVPIPIYFSVKLFNVTNSKEVEKGAKPKLQEVGPYVYEEKRRKFNIVWNEDETQVKYRQKVEYFFRPDLSTGTEQDVLTFLNVPLAVIAASLAKTPRLQRSVAVEFVDQHEEKLFVQRTVEELMFKGYHQPTIADLEKLKGEKMLVNETFGLFFPKNGSDEGEYKIFSGVGDSSKFGKVISWENQTELTLWPNATCNMINGSDGSLFPPFVTRDRVLQVFSGELCRSAYFTYERDSEFKGIPTYRFTFPKKLFENPKVNEDNKCFCPEPEKNKNVEDGGTGFEGCQKGGTHSLAACRKGAPIYMSLPHFYNGDQELLDDVEGLKPVYELHAASIELEPTSGVFLQIKKRVQINVQLTKSKDLMQFRKAPTVLFPLLWLEETATINEEGADMIKEKLLGTLKKADTGKWVGIAVGCLLAIAGIGIFVLRSCNRRYKVTA